MQRLMTATSKVMRRNLVLAATVLAVLGCGGLRLHAQTDSQGEKGTSRSDPPPVMADDVPDNGHHYYPPGAVKSVEIGNFYLRRGQYPGALSRFEEARDTDPHYAPAYLGLGKVYEKLGFKQKALDAYRRYLDELPSDKDAINARGARTAIARLERQLRAKPQAPRTAKD